MKHCYIYLFLLYAFIAESKIYDCFLFFNELEVLEIRLNEMYDYVDHFVLVECHETFRGNPKPLHYKENEHLFSKYADKIIHVLADNHPPTNNPWDREAFQRNQMKKGLGGCTNEDIVIISDLDEIIRGTDIPRLIENLKEPSNPAVTVVHRFYQWQLNRLSPHFDGLWNGSVATTYKYFKGTTTQSLRERKDHFPKVWDAGWHFTSMGGISRVIPKIEAYCHSEIDIPKNKNPEHLRYLSTLGTRVVPIDASFPRIIQEQKERYEQLGFIEPVY